MKIVVSNIEGMRASIEALVNTSFAAITAVDIEHMQKASEARSILTGSEPSAAFVEAAAIEGMSAQELAGVIAAKSSTIMERGNRRREWVRKVRAARSVAELDAIRSHFDVDNPHKMG